MAQEREIYLVTGKNFTVGGKWLRVLGWLRIAFNLTFITPAIRRIVGLDFRSVLYDNLYIYFFSRFMYRIRDRKVSDQLEQKVANYGA